MKKNRSILPPPPRDLTGKTVLVLGLGASGEWAARLAHRKGARVLVADDGEPGKVAARLGGLQREVAHFYFGKETAQAPLADLLVLSPGVSPAHPLAARQIENGRAVLPEIEFADRHAPPASLRVGITGTNGKSTTTALIGHLLQRAGRRVAVGGNLGEPYAKLVMEQPDAEVYVLELSSFQLETTQHFHVNTGVYLNLTPDHLDRHGTLSAYADAKAKLFARQTADDHAIYNADDEAASAAALGSPARRWPLSTARQIPGGGYYVGDTGYGRDERLFDFSKLHLIGEPNRQNAIAAALAALACGVKPWEIAPAMESFRPLPHRLETVATARGVRMINDSKGTNVDATLGAVRGLPPPLVVILGGRDKDQDFSPLLAPLKERARKVVLYGEAAAKIGGALASLQPLRAGPLAEAVDLALDCAQPGDVLLFSPACASFDQFRNFEHRGEVFRELARQAVKRLGGTVEEVRA
jgi:UDP-N-acetylmuramoylalanine--D-glutamate ligase